MWLYVCMQGCTGKLGETRRKTRKISAIAVLTATAINNNINQRVILVVLTFYFIEIGLIFVIFWYFYDVVSFDTSPVAPGKKIKPRTCVPP